MAKKSSTKKSTAKPTKAKAASVKKAAPAKSKSSTATLEGTLTQLKSLGNAAVRAQNAKGGAWGAGAGDNQFGVKRGDLRTLANKIKTNHELAQSLWKTGNVDAQQLATLLIDGKRLSAAELEQMVKSISFAWVADWLHSYVTKEHADKETLRQKWLTSKDRWTARAGWQLTAGRVAKSPEGLDLAALLTRIEKEMAAAAPEVQWTMNMCLAEIGIHFPEHRQRALAIGEKLGIYRDYPCAKGCTSPFAPIWINEMVKRQTK
jgi:3-methyladenine DNA glycosylase AlkD